MLDERSNQNVREVYAQRIEAIKRFCEVVLEQKNAKKRR